MIPDLDLPEYYITSVDVNVEPEIGHTVQGQVSMSFDMSDPEMYEDPEGLFCEADLDLDLYREGEAPWQTTDSENKPFGEIGIETIIFISGTRSEFEPSLSDWEEESYHDVDEDLKHHIESGILHQIVSPIGDLVENSFNGVVPRMIFSPPERD
jgi:hypothetical protein